MTKMARAVALLLLLCFLLPSSAGAVQLADPAASDGVPVAADDPLAWPPPWGDSRIKLPVLLVNSPGTDPERVWGGKGGLAERLKKAGHAVFYADLSLETDPDPVRLARV
ncbi:MAG TPA: hypothetical protein GX513_13090, partial [Firmicutes bacterium]|nr:hypothetical protein [Bacillota bacterium]